MPEICRFQGIILRMLFRDDEQHHKPHIHAVYGEYKASIALDGTLVWDDGDIDIAPETVYKESFEYVPLKDVV